MVENRGFGEPHHPNGGKTGGKLPYMVRVGRNLHHLGTPLRCSDPRQALDDGIGQQPPPPGQHRAGQFFGLNQAFRHKFSGFG